MTWVEGHLDVVLQVFAEQPQLGLGRNVRRGVAPAPPPADEHGVLPEGCGRSQLAPLMEQPVAGRAESGQVTRLLDTAPVVGPVVRL